MELYYDRSTNWREGGYGGGRKAVVVDDKRYRINQQSWGFRRERYTEDPKGTAVLVDIHRERQPGEFRVDREAVPAAHLRGLWDQLHAEITARQEENRQVSERVEVERKALHSRADALMARAAAAGFEVGVSYGYGGQRTFIELSVEEFERLLGAAGVAGGNHIDA
jgi:hypothetical protein